MSVIKRLRYRCTKPTVVTVRRTCLIWVARSCANVATAGVFGPLFWARLVAIWTTLVELCWGIIIVL